MPDTMSLDEIRDYWREQAVVHGQSAAASWSDQPAIDLEIREIAEQLVDGDRVLDVGCANGYSTVQLAMRRRITVRGVDYIPEMIAEAQQRLMAVPAELASRVEFGVGDITQLREEPGGYDKLVVIRVLINLRTWERQLLAMRECARVLKPGGVLLLSEATIGGWQALNAFRAEWGLDAIPMPPFNQYLDEGQLTEAVADLYELSEIRNFASTYYVGSRVIKPILARLSQAGVDVSKADMHWNRFCSLLPAAGEYGTQKLFVFRKR